MRSSTTSLTCSSLFRLDRLPSIAGSATRPPNLLLACGRVKRHVPLCRLVDLTRCEKRNGARSDRAAAVDGHLHCGDRCVIRQVCDDEGVGVPESEIEALKGAP